MNRILFVDDEPQLLARLRSDTEQRERMAEPRVPAS